MHPPWTKETAIEALREFERVHGRRPVQGIDTHRSSVTGLPGTAALRRLFDSEGNAWVLAFGEANPRAPNKDPDTEEVIRRLAEGCTLKELGEERGVSGQSLGRRVRRYQEAYGLEVVNRRPGRPPKKKQ